MNANSKHKYCTQCGASLLQNAKFCAKCGTQVIKKVEKIDVSQQLGSFAISPPTFEYKDNNPHSNIIKHTVTNKKTGKSEETVEFKDLHPSAVWLFFLAYIKNTAILAVLLLGVIFLEPLLALGLLAYLFILFIVAKIAYNNYKFKVTPTSFRKEFGIVHKQTVSVPFERIQNVNIRRSLLDRMLGLSHIEMETAGTGGNVAKDIIGGTSSTSEGYIPGVDPTEAVDLKDLILLRSQHSKSNNT